jgi:hypothetical protein
MIGPLNEDVVPSVAELPTCQNTWQAWAPLMTLTWLAEAVISVEATWNENRVRVALTVQRHRAAQRERTGGLVDRMMPRTITPCSPPVCDVLGRGAVRTAFGTRATPAGGRVDGRSGLLPGVQCGGEIVGVESPADRPVSTQARSPAGAPRPASVCLDRGCCSACGPDGRHRRLLRPATRREGSLTQLRVELQCGPTVGVPSGARTAPGRLRLAGAAGIGELFLAPTDRAV